MLGTAIIGGGFCGTMVAVHLAQAGQTVTLIECGRNAGRGLAYGTTDIRHLLNVRAGNMSAYPDRPVHFVEWLAAHPGLFQERSLSQPSQDSFVPRLIYGEYLRDILMEASSRHPGLTILQAEVCGIEPQDGGFILPLADGRAITAAKVVLATGNLSPGNGAENPYDPALWAELAKPGDILIAGTGLTALDLIVTLADTKRQGTIHVMSRSGLFPQVHAPAVSYPPMFNGADLPRSPVRLLHAVRREIRRCAVEGIRWQAVIDGLRHRNQELWQAMGADGQRRFLHRLRPYWDTHRHRCAPEIMAVKMRLEAEGRLYLHRGAFLSSHTDSEDTVAVWKPHGQAEAQQLLVHHIADCTGPQGDIARLKSGLLKSLFDSGLVSVPENRMGLRADGDYTVLDTTGQRVEGLYALGNLLKGQLYESVAVPELRVQALQVADTITHQIN